ncbi:hypothetical protein [Chitinophaga varians]|uniref:hypothetical protein n=1 Tax=Chitinophaga varians TaxID=2202339 RepID=UPI00165F097C|nr:hypothetical protein [Chitinophaga varians]MBC9908815.1 hypothetical protein [Chitinophaga varians]
MNFNVDKFIHTGTFLGKAIDADWLQKHCDDIFGEDILMYYFYQDGLAISFVFDGPKKRLLAEQAEIPRTPDSNEFTSYDKFVHKYDALITDIYRDQTETVVFMKNGVNAHFNHLLTKITSKSDAARKLVVSIMNKIR